MQLVVGLGNPGRRYASTRHNAGFLVIDRLAERWSVSLAKRQFKADVGPARIADRSVLLCKPQTFMNLSGEAVASLKGYYKVDTEEIVVVHDDLELPFGDVQARTGGGHRGHNGLRDLMRRIGAGFERVRVGIGRPPPGWDPADYVLGSWSKAEAETLDAVVDRAADTVERVLREPR